LQTQQIPYEKNRNPYCWLFELLRAGAGQIDDPLIYGFSKIGLFEQQTLTDIRQEIDEEFHSLSMAHYERYIVANSKRANRAPSSKP